MCLHVCIYIYTHTHTLNNRFLVSLLSKPLDELLAGDFQSGASPRSCETFLRTFCIESTTAYLSWWDKHHVWIPSSPALPRPPELYSKSANIKKRDSTLHFAGP